MTEGLLQAQYLALILALCGATFGVRAAGGGLFVLEPDGGDGDHGLTYYIYLLVAMLSVLLATGLLLASYMLLDWRFVLVIHLLFTLLPAMAGTLFGDWRARGPGRHILLKVAAFHILSVAAGGYMITTYLG